MTSKRTSKNASNSPVEQRTKHATNDMAGKETDIKDAVSCVDAVNAMFWCAGECFYLLDVTVPAAAYTPCVQRPVRR